VQPFQEGRTSTYLTLQAPVPTNKFDKFATLPDDDLVDVLEDARQDERRNDRGARLVCLGVRPS
jgi:hypothetical protein